MSFWYHLPYSEIVHMPISAIDLYMERLPKYQAELRLIFGEITMLPYMDKDDRSSWRRELEDILQQGKKVKVLSSPAMFATIGIGIYKEK